MGTTAQTIYDSVKAAEPSFRKFLETTTKIDWKLKSFKDMTAQGETLVTWESDKGKLTLVASSVSDKVVDIRLHYNHPNGDPEQPRAGRVAIGKVGDPKAVLGNLLAKYKGKVEWKAASARLASSDPLIEFKNVVVARNVAARFSAK